MSVCCMTFWICLLVAGGLVLVSLPLWQDRSQWTDEWKVHFARKCLALKWCLLIRLSAGRWTKCYNWPVSLNCKSWLAVAQPQANASCWQTLSLPLDTSRHESVHFIDIFGCHDFIMGIIASYSLLGPDKLCPMRNGWQRLVSTNHVEMMSSKVRI